MKGIITKFKDGSNQFWVEGKGWTRYRHEATRYTVTERGKEISEARKLAVQLGAELEYDG